MNELELKGSNAKKASYSLMNMSTSKKNEILKEIGIALRNNSSIIIEANKIDIANAIKNNLSIGIIDRLTLNVDRIEAIAIGVDKLIQIEDPIGSVIKMWKRPNGLTIGQKRVPLGVVGMIYEARPNVSVDAAALCIKSGNAVMLRGSKTAINSNIALVNIMKEALNKVGVSTGCIELIEDTSHETANKFMQLNEYLSVIIPRGGANLIKATIDNATVPVIETGTGNCHTYVDASADLDMALKIILNAKTQRTSVCNACESLVLHSSIAAQFLKLAVPALKAANVKIHGCKRCCALSPDLILATEEDYACEYLALELSIIIVDELSEAIEHINKYSTHHSETIVTSNYDASQIFLDCIDSACVYVNASTRFSDGFEFGFGAEIGISNQKIHARGPMGLEALTTIKYIIYGNGQIR
ncbi:MAG: glutamate-5-semialdehyde dehydrogenase [Erysipelotrichaceae bacterium]